MGIRDRARGYRAARSSRKAGGRHENYQQILDYIKRQAAKGSEMHQYMLNRYHDYLRQGENFQTAVRKARQSGVLFQANKRLRLAQQAKQAALASGNAAAVRRANAQITKWQNKAGSLGAMVRGHALSRTQKGQQIAYIRSKHTPVPGTPATFTSLSREMVKRLKNIIFIIGFYALLALASITVPPFFGLPPFWMLFWAFIVRIFFIFTPTESEVINAYTMKFSNAPTPIGWRGGAGLLSRTILRALYYILLILQFMTYNFPFFRIIAIIIAFIYYSSLPLRYKATQPHRLMEAWARPAFAVFLAWLFMTTFGGNVVGLSLGAMSLAFFASLPIIIEETDREQKGQVVVKVDMLGKRKDSLNTGIFIVCMLASAWFSIMQPQMWTGQGDMFWAFAIIWGISFFSGLSTGTAGRPSLGIMMIIISLIVFSSTFTGYMGQALFGYWWPQVLGGIQWVGETFGPMWEGFQNAMGESWLMLTNPAGYYEMMMRRQQASTTRIKEGGSPLSIEMSRFELFVSISSILEPKFDPVVGTIELENRGEFHADTIEAIVWAEWVNPNTTKRRETGIFRKFNCSYPSDSGTGLRSLPPPGPQYEVGSCNWTEVAYPNEIKQCSFAYQMNNWNTVYEEPGSVPPVLRAIDLANVIQVDINPDPAVTEYVDVYEFGTNMINFRMNYSYHYNVNVSMPVEIINYDLYEDLLNAKEIILEELTSQYTGGPIKATLWSQRQPIRDTDESLFVASIFNDGYGETILIDPFEVWIPDELVDSVDVVGHTFDTCTNSPITASDGYYKIICSFDAEPPSTNKPIENSEYKRVSFFLKPRPIADKVKKTTLIIGKAKYKYRKEESQTLSIANSPLQ